MLGAQQCGALGVIEWAGERLSEQDARRLHVGHEHAVVGAERREGRDSCRRGDQHPQPSNGHTRRAAHQVVCGPSPVDVSARGHRPRGTPPCAGTSPIKTTCSARSGDSDLSSGSIPAARSISRSSSSRAVYSTPANALASFCPSASIAVDSDSASAASRAPRCSFGYRTPRVGIRCGGTACCEC